MPYQIGDVVSYGESQYEVVAVDGCLLTLIRGIVEPEMCIVLADHVSLVAEQRPLIEDGG